MRLNSLAVGQDGRNRTGLMPFGSKTGRNQPSNSRFIFGTSRWLRSLIQPAPGRALAYVDWSSQEIAIAAALSGDDALSGFYVFPKTSVFKRSHQLGCDRYALGIRATKLFASGTCHNLPRSTR